VSLLVILDKLILQCAVLDVQFLIHNMSMNTGGLISLYTKSVQIKLVIYSQGSHSNLRIRIQYFFRTFQDLIYQTISTYFTLFWASAYEFDSKQDTVKLHAIALLSSLSMIKIMQM